MKTLQIVFFGLFLVFVSCGSKEEKKDIPVKKEDPVKVIKEKKTEPKAQPLIFSVQIGAFEYGNTKLEALNNVVISNENGLKIYRIGTYVTYQEARNARRNLLGTYPDAFVQALKDGKRVDIITALKSKK